MSQVRIASSAYTLDWLESETHYREKISQWVEAAVQENAQLIVFPEYASLELGSLAGEEVASDIYKLIDAVSERLDLQFEVHSKLAKKHGVTIVSASAPQRHEDGRVTNVARIFAPNGKSGEYHKLMPTPWERDPWGISCGPASNLTLFDLGFAKVGLVICYDIEFPLLSRALTEAGAQIILAPSVTESEWGYWRVRTGCTARALENQLYTVQAPMVGEASWCEPADTSFGAAGIFGPSDTGLPAGGIIALGEMNKPGWVFADLDLELLQTMRQSGGVQTFNHWPEQPGATPLPKPKLVSLV